jgi:hypothetical protein
MTIILRVVGLVAPYLGRLPPVLPVSIAKFHGLRCKRV